MKTILDVLATLSLLILVTGILSMFKTLDFMGGGAGVGVRTVIVLILAWLVLWRIWV